MALVIGNDAYARGPLRNAVNDAHAMSRVLSELGFVVETLENATRVRLGKAVDGFVGRLGAGDVGFFYYAGHGIQVEGRAARRASRGAMPARTRPSPGATVSSGSSSIRR